MKQPRTKRKLKLTDDTPRPLKLWFFIRRLEPIEILDEGIVCILAYDLKEAVVNARTKSPKHHIKYTGQDITIEELLERLRAYSYFAPPKNRKEKKIKPEDLNKKRFKMGLMLACDKFITGKDKTTLKSILKKM